MNASVDAYRKRLRDEVAAVEHEIETRNQHIETLSKRLDGLKRALELCNSEQPAVAELLRSWLSEQAGRARSGAVTRKIASAGKTVTVAREPVAIASRTSPPNGGARGAGMRAGSSGAMRRVDMIAAVLKRHPRQTVREIIERLELQFSWKCGESNLTAHLYTNPDKFVHTKGDRSGKHLVTWSAK